MTLPGGCQAPFCNSPSSGSHVHDKSTVSPMSGILILWTLELRRRPLDTSGGASRGACRDAEISVSSTLLRMLGIPSSRCFAFLRKRVPGPAPSASNPRAEAATAFARGQQALQTGDLATADASFRKVLSIDPQAGPAYANLGVIAMRRQQWDHALTLLEKAEKLDPRMAGIRLNIGLVKYRREDYVGAMPSLESVLRDQPTPRKRATCWVCASSTPSAIPPLSRRSSRCGRLLRTTSCISTR